MRLCGVLACLTLIFLSQVNGSKILAIIHGASYSHYSLGLKLLRPLAEKGHNVTMVSAYSLQDPPETWKDIVLKDYMKGFEFGGSVLSLATMSAYAKVMHTDFFGVDITKRVLRHPAFEQLLKSNETFDLVILENLMNEAMIGVAHRFNAPYVLLSTIGYSKWANEPVGNPGSTAYIPDLFLHYGYGMTLWKRFHNTFFNCYAKLYTYFVTFPKQKILYKEVFPEAPPLEDLYYNASLILMNAHVSIRYGVPSVPNMIDIGGYHVNSPKELPKDIKEYMDSATNGVIYFSLGSGLKSKDLPIQTRDSILRVFSKLKQNILWKWEDDANFAIPPNVKLEKWFPQQDILAHPNLKLFITHGGLLSNIEAVYHGVPMLAIPIFAEQFMNAAEIESLEYGLQLHITDFSEEKFSSRINELLTNKKYRENIKFRSKVFHDRELKPIDRAIWWIEYVIRHKGAPHLRSVTLNLTWYQYLLLDVLALGALIVLLISLSVSILIKKIFRKSGKLKTS